MRCRSFRRCTSTLILPFYLQRALNTAIGGNANSVYLIVGSIGTPSGEGLDFINGQTFLERFYAVFDTANSRVGIANTPFTDATTN